MAAAQPEQTKKKTPPGPEPAQEQAASTMELVLQARARHSGIRLSDLLRAVLSSRSRFFRQAARQELGLPLLFPRGRKPVILPQDQVIMDELRKLVKGNHRRLKGRGAFATGHPDIPDHSMRRLIGLLKEEMRIKRRDTLLEVLYQEPGMIWSMDIFERRFAGRKEYVLQVIDLGSRFKLAPAIQNRDFTAWEVAEHLNKLFLKHGAPLFLKRDNGGNLNGEPVEKLLNCFCAIPQNSPPYTPPYNGVVERMQGEVKADLDRLLAGGDICQCIFTGAVMNAVFIANARPREALQGKTANDRFVPPMGKYSKEERQDVNDWICRRARDIAGNAGPFFHGTEKEKLPDSAWRLAIREWQENHGFIAFQKKGKIIRLSMIQDEIVPGPEAVCRISFIKMKNH